MLLAGRCLVCCQHSRLRCSSEPGAKVKEKRRMRLLLTDFLVLIDVAHLHPIKDLQTFLAPPFIPLPYFCLIFHRVQCWTLGRSSSTPATCASSEPRPPDLKLHHPGLRPCPLPLPPSPQNPGSGGGGERVESRKARRGGATTLSLR